MPFTYAHAINANMQSIIGCALNCLQIESYDMVRLTLFIPLFSQACPFVSHILPSFLLINHVISWSHLLFHVQKWRYPVNYLFHTIHFSILFFPFVMFYLFLLLLFYCIFPMNIYSPYTPSPLQSPHCCPCPWVLIHFCSIPPPLKSLITVSLLSVYGSVPILLVSSVCSLDSTLSEIIWCLSFSDQFISLQHNVLQVHPYCHKGQIFLFLNGQVVFHCINVP